MTQRTCESTGCSRAHLARGLCSTHYGDWWYSQSGKSKHPQYERECVTCGGTWLTARTEARFCTAKCKGAYLSVINRRSCPLPDDHPVILRTAAIKVAAAEAKAEMRRAARPERPQSSYEWRTARECPGCACWFTPLYTSTAVCCSVRCSRRMGRRRRRAREHGARGSWTWSEFMRIASKFGYCCAYCGVKPDRLDPDHVVPLSRGGSDSPSNLLPSCLMCNSSKCAMTLDEWSAWLASRGLPPRLTTWRTDDGRYTHLTDALLRI